MSWSEERRREEGRGGEGRGCWASSSVVLTYVRSRAVGELARLFKGEFLVNASSLSLAIVPMVGWTRSMTYPDTGLLWVPPSPNMPTFDTAVVYAGDFFSARLFFIIFFHFSFVYSLRCSLQAWVCSRELSSRPVAGPPGPLRRLEPPSSRWELAVPLFPFHSLSQSICRR